jgi:hypothetical protein
MQQNVDVWYYLTLIITVLISIVCIGWPEKVRYYYLKYDRFGKYNPLRNWVRSSGYICYLRLFGIIWIFTMILFTLGVLGILKISW